MINRIISVRKHEWRTVILLGSYYFVMLAATTMMVTASDALFVGAFDAQRLPYGIAAAQICSVGGFYLYRLLRRVVPTRWLNVCASLLLVLGVSALFYYLWRGYTEAIFAFITIVPLYQAILGAEYGRMSASLIDARSARRLLPLLGAIGGAGAAGGALLVSWVSEQWTQIYVVPIVAGCIMLLLIPASLIKESQRPRASTAHAGIGEVFAHRYALALLLAGALIIALSTIVRTQFGAMASENFSGDELGVFYGNFFSWLNLASIFFALIASNWLMSNLGAARSLLFYPGIMGLIAAVGTQLPQLLVTSASQFMERLVRQNIHNTASTIAGMPIKVSVRIRMAMLSSGVVKPLAVLATSGALLVTFGNLSLFETAISWQQLYYPVVVLALLLIALMWFVRRRYAAALTDALHARRLQLDYEQKDDELLSMVPMDPALRRTLHGYLSSDLQERVGLALELLEGHENGETVALIMQHWPLWEDWTRIRAVTSLSRTADDEAREFLRRQFTQESDAVQAALLAHDADNFSTAELWALLGEDGANGDGGPDQGRSHAQVGTTDSAAGTLLKTAAVAQLVQRQAPALQERLRAWLQGEVSEGQAQLAAECLRGWPDGQLDDVLPRLLPLAPQAVLEVMAARPQAAYAELCIPWLSREQTYNAARGVLLALGEHAIAALERAALDPFASNSSFGVLAEIEGRGAHLAGMRLMANASQDVRNRAAKARLRAPYAISSPEMALVRENAEEAVNQAERFHAYMLNSAGVAESVARSERDAALEDVFLNLTLADPDTPFRQMLLAVQGFDQKQKALALELLDEHLPNRMSKRLVPVLEDEPIRSSHDIDADRDWLQLQERLDQKVPQTAHESIALRTLKEVPLFARWRVSELEALVQLGQMEVGPAALVLRDGVAVQLEETLLSGRTPPLREADVCLPLDLLYRALNAAPRCGQLWLQSLAARMPAPVQGQVEVTRSAMVSLASRAVAEDHAASGEIDIWQRMFFLRSSTLGQNLPAARLRLLAQISKTLSAGAGELVVHEGRLGHHFYLLCTGAAEVSLQGQVLHKLGPSDGFGALSLIQGQRRPVTVRVTQDSELIAISRIDFLDLLETHPALVRSMARNLANQILSLQELDGSASLSAD